jgi:hypothetical protein
MKWTEVEKKYGKAMSKKMLKVLAGCTVGVDKNGVEDFYDYDVEWAYRHVTGEIKVEDLEWD